MSLGEIAVEVIADIGRLRTGLNQGIALINKFSQQATRGARTVGTGFQQTAKQVGVGSKFMGSEYNRFAIGAQKTSAQVSKAVQTQTTRVKEAAKGVEGMGTAARKVKPKMDEFTGGILNITKHLGKWISFNLTWFATWRLMWTALRWLKAGVAAIIDFDTAITALGAVTAATQEQLLSLEDTARDVGATTRFTAVEVAEAMVDLSKAGFSVSEVNRMISGTALLAIGTLSDLTQTTQLVAVTLRTFHLEASEAAMVANVFAAAITNSRLTIDSLRNSLKYIGPIMAEMGYTINDTAAVLGVLADRGIEAGISARGLRGFFSALIAVTPKLKKELDKVGLSVSEVSPLTNDLAVILTRLKQAGFDVTSAMRGLERRVGTTAIALISAADYFEILRDAITGTTAAEVIAEMQTESLGYRLILLRSQATELALDFRDVFLPSIQGLLSALSAFLVTINEVTSRLVELLNLFPPWARQLIIVGGLFTALVGLIGLFSVGVGKGTASLTLFSLGFSVLITKVVAGAKAFGIWGLVITGIILGFTYLISRIRAAREATTEHRKEVAAQLLSLQKQRTELARTAVTLETYRDNEEKLRRVLEGLADTYPEIATLLMKEHVTYEEAIGVVNRLLEVKEKEAEVRRKDVVEAIEAEIEALEKSIASVEESAARIDAALPFLKQLLQFWFWIKEGTFDADKALKLLNERLGKAEERLRTITGAGREAARSIEEQLEAFEELGPTALYWYQLMKKSGRTYLFLLDAAIEEQRREFHTIQETWEALDRKGKMQKGLTEDELKQYEDLYKALEKSRGQLESLEADRRKFAEAREKAEAALLAAIDKRALTEVELYERLIDFAKLDLAGYRDRLRLVGQLTEEEKADRNKLYLTLEALTEKYTSVVIKENAKMGISQEQTRKQVIEIWNTLARYIPGLWGKVVRIIASYNEEITKAYEKQEVDLIAIWERMRKRREELAKRTWDLLIESAKDVLKAEEFSTKMRLEYFRTLLSREREDMRLRKKYGEDYSDFQKFLLKAIAALAQQLREEDLENEKEFQQRRIEVWERTRDRRMELEKEGRETQIESVRAVLDADEFSTKMRLDYLRTLLAREREDMGTRKKLGEDYSDFQKFLLKAIAALAQQLREEDLENEKEFQQRRIEVWERTRDRRMELEKEGRETQIESVKAVLDADEFSTKMRLDYLRTLLAGEREDMRTRKKLGEDYSDFQKFLLRAIAKLAKELTAERTDFETKYFEFLRKMGLRSLDDAIKRQQKLTKETKANTIERLEAQLVLYSLISEQEGKLTENLIERGRTNAEIEAKIRALWLEHYQYLFESFEEFEEFFKEHWRDLSEDLGLVPKTISGAWDKMLTDLTNRIRAWFADQGKAWVLFGDLIARTVKTTVEGIANALTNLFDYWWKGGDRATRFTRDQAQKRLDYIRRELEEEARLHGQYTERYKELLNEQARAHAELAEAEFALLQERQAIWRNFINAIIKEIIRLIVQMLVALAVKLLLLALGVPVGGGGPVPAEAGGEVPAGVGPGMKRGGLIKKLQKRLQDLQKGGEVLVRAHEGEYVIPEPIVTRIKRTREVPEELVEGIVASKPPSYQRGGEIGIAERAPATLIVNFQPGTTFTELEKTQARQYFERTWLPLWRETQRREQAARW